MPSPFPSPRPPNRRAFLRHLAGASAAAFVSQRLVTRSHAAPARPTPSNRITLGVIGTGRQSVHANIPGFLREPDAQIVALCDVDAWRLERARKQVDSHYARATASGKFSGCAIHRDWRELIARPDIDAVMIATPDHWHVLMAVAALRAGKDVACEKPLTRNIAEGRLLADTVRRERRVFRTDSEFRSIRAFHRAVHLVRLGRIGTLRRILTCTPKDSTLPAQPTAPVPEELDYEMWLGPAPAADYTEKRVHPRHDDRGRPGWITIRDYADGMLANWGAHLNDIAMWGNDSEHTGPVEIEARGEFPPAESLWNVVQDFEAHFRFANGVRLTCRTGDPSVRFEGDEGWIAIKYPGELTTHPAALAESGPLPDDPRFPLKTSEKRDFLDAVVSRQPPLYDAETGHRVAALSHLAIAAMELGRPIHWDPKAEHAVADPAADRQLAPKPQRAPWILS